MSSLKPWTVGSHEERWNGYLIAPDSAVLSNKVGAITDRSLRSAEDDLLEARLAELRENPRLVPPTYDLRHLQALHRHLLQDVYEWAGELRTVGLAKGGGDSFMPPLQIEVPVGHAATRIQESGLLLNVDPAGFAHEVAYLYDYLNFAHPFREGNGRIQREFFAQLVAESGHGLDWERIEMKALHDACHLARTDGSLDALEGIFELIITEDPSY